MSPRYDVAIVGGGIVGLATALALVQRSRGSVVVLEAEGRLAAHARQGERGGGDIKTNARVTDVRREANGLHIETEVGPVRAGLLVNCAGLHADRLARMCHLDPQVQIVPFRGDYYELVPERRAMVRGLIYPMPDPALSFLGAHFTRTIDDRVEAGPNAVLAFSREGYAPWTLRS